MHLSLNGSIYLSDIYILGNLFKEIFVFSLTSSEADKAIVTLPIMKMLQARVESLFKSIGGHVASDGMLENCLLKPLQKIKLTKHR